MNRHIRHRLSSRQDNDRVKGSFAKTIKADFPLGGLFNERWNDYLLRIRRQGEKTRAATQN